jgi:formylglycine-generating enzyme required for sulfatase activity
VAANTPDPSGTTPGGGRARIRRPDVRQLLDALQQEAPEQPKLLANSLGLKFALIPAGVFLMGSAETEAGRRCNESPQHEVAVTRPFYLGLYPVTQEQYEKVTGVNPARFNRDGGGGPDYPVEQVSWLDAVAFCKKLSALPEEKEAGRVYRLPTEAEWEYACRAGTTTAFGHGAMLSAAQANFDGAFPYGGVDRGESAGKTSRVGAYPANNYKLHDLHGNVWEWCADWFHDSYYRRSPRNDPPGPASGQFRVLRGGCWRSHAATCRAAYRNALAPHHRDIYTGFRVVATLAAK